MRETNDCSDAYRHAKPLLLSFSGIDGAGKTTQIENLALWLSGGGLRVRLVRFWEDVVLFRREREAIAHSLFHGDSGVGVPGAPVRRNDKNVQSWSLTPLRVSLCFLDLLGLAMVMARIRHRQDVDVVIFDRYLYDQVANLNTSNPLIRTCIRLLLRLVPRPHIAYLLDADPIQARERKPEYPVEFLQYNRASYLALSTIAGMNVIPAGTTEEAGTLVRSQVLAKLTSSSIWPVAETLTSRQS